MTKVANVELCQDISPYNMDSPPILWVKDLRGKGAQDANIMAMPTQLATKAIIRSDYMS
jgi:hypothetical protein